MKKNAVATFQRMNSRGGPGSLVISVDGIKITLKIEADVELDLVRLITGARRSSVEVVSEVETKLERELLLMTDRAKRAERMLDSLGLTTEEK